MVDLHRWNLLNLTEWRSRLIVIDQGIADVRLGESGEYLRRNRVNPAGRYNVPGEGLADQVARLRVGRCRLRILDSVLENRPPQDIRSQISLCHELQADEVVASQRVVCLFVCATCRIIL